MTVRLATDADGPALLEIAKGLAAEQQAQLLDILIAQGCLVFDEGDGKPSALLFRTHDAALHYLEAAKGGTP